MDEQPSSGIDTTTPHPARRYNYWLGGKDNFAVDRQSGDEFLRLYPTAKLSAVENRRFLGRAVRFLAAEAGIRQFLDIGTGIPTAGNTHEVAQSVAAESRIAYADNDPLVLAHARALLTSHPDGATTYLHADVREPAVILADPALKSTLDLSRPVGLIMVAVLHFVAGENAAKQIVGHLLDALAPGSFLVLSHATNEYLSPEVKAAFLEMYDSGRSDVWPRGRDEVTALFDGLDVVDPGVVPVAEWRRTPADGETPAPEAVSIWAGVGRKR